MDAFMLWYLDYLAKDLSLEEEIVGVSVLSAVKERFY